MPEREIRYCTAEDGVRIAYRVDGDGPPLLVCHEAVESFSCDHLVPEQEAFFRELGRGRCVVRFDPRGVGLSQRDIDDFSLKAQSRDIQAVIQATGFKHLSLLAWCMSGPAAIAFVASHPREVQRLVLYATTARPSYVPKESVLAFAELWRTNPAVAARTLADLTEREQYPAVTFQLASVFMQSITGADASRWFQSVAEEGVDVTPLLPRVRVPTLVLHRRGDSGYPVAEAQMLASQIPNAKLVLLEGTHYFAVDDSGAIIDAMNAFLGDEGPRTPRRSSMKTNTATLRTVLFTDLASSTAITRRLGDAQAQDLVRAHNAIVRQALTACGGSEVKHTGDGIMASFPTASGALECAVAVQRGVAARADDQLAVHIGLNAGEPVAEDADLFGTSVQLARRICDHADAGQIVVSNVVRELAAGKGFLFSDIGEVVPKGFEEPVRLYEVRWREDPLASTHDM